MNPSPETYDNAVRILAEQMRPFRAAELYHLSFKPTPGHEHPGCGREDERFRERLAQRRAAVIKQGPWFALKRWIIPVIPFAARSDSITIPLTRDCVQHAAWESMQRVEHMVVRNPRASKQARYMAAINGFTVEQHVKRYFMLNWTNSYRGASNEGLWHRPAPDDFNLIVGRKRFRVDVMGADQADPPLWRLIDGKMLGAQLRIIAYYDEVSIEMLGYQWSTSGVKDLLPMERLIVRLNIQEVPDCLCYFRDCMP